MMKNTILIFSLLFCFQLNAQNADKQWYIKNTQGLAGNSQYTNSIPDQFRIKHVSHPTIWLDPRAKDDVFVIFDGGDYYSSRYIKTNPIAITNGNVAKFNSAENPQYLYWTNIYDQDDPPEQIIADGNLTNPTINIGYEIMMNSFDNDLIDQNSKLLANHSVVSGKDITLIINFEDIQHTNSRLRYNKLTPSSNVDMGKLIDTKNFIIRSNLFAPSHVFKNDFILGASATDITSDSLIITNQNQFAYVNFRGTETLEEFINAGGENPEWAAVFELVDINTGDPTAQLAEHTGPRHDPNEIVAMGVCHQSRFVRYKGQFYNETEHNAVGLAMEIEFPAMIDMKNITLTSIKVGGRKTTPTISYAGNKMVVVMDRHLGSKISRLKHRIDTAKVEFEICAKLNPGVTDDMILQDSLKVNNAEAFFNYNDPSSRLAFPMKRKERVSLIDSLISKFDDTTCRSCKNMTPPMPKLCNKWKWWNFWYLEGYRYCPGSTKWFRLLIPIGLLLLLTLVYSGSKK